MQIDVVYLLANIDQLYNNRTSWEGQKPSHSTNLSRTGTASLALCVKPLWIGTWYLGNFPPMPQWEPSPKGRPFGKKKTFRNLPVTKCRSCLWFCHCTCWDVGSANQDKCGLKTVVRWRSFSNKIWRRIQKAEDFCCGLGTCDMCEEVRTQHHEAVCNDIKRYNKWSIYPQVWSKLWLWYLSINTTSLAKSNSLPNSVSSCVTKITCQTCPFLPTPLPGQLPTSPEAGLDNEPPKPTRWSRSDPATAWT